MRHDQIESLHDQILRTRAQIAQRERRLNAPAPPPVRYPGLPYASSGHGSGKWRLEAEKELQVYKAELVALEASLESLVRKPKPELIPEPVPPPAQHKGDTGKPRKGNVSALNPEQLDKGERIARMYQELKLLAKREEGNRPKTEKQLRDAHPNLVELWNEIDASQLTEEQKKTFFHGLRGHGRQGFMDFIGQRFGLSGDRVSTLEKAYRSYERSLLVLDPTDRKTK